MLKPFLIASAALVLIAQPTISRAEDRASVRMVLGDDVAAPIGFSDLCLRSVADCTTGAESDEDLEDVRLWAGRSRWAAIFAQSPVVAVEPAANSFAEPAGPLALSPALDADVLELLSKCCGFALGGLKPAEDLTALAPSSSPEADATVRPTMRLLNRINRGVNRRIRSDSDAALYGRQDYWASSNDNVTRGDCEDYVIAKRRELIDAGVSPEALSIAIVRTRWNVTHAVLLVQTEDGEQVLDNLTPWIVRWDKAPYTWIQRQRAGSPRSWVTLLDA